MPRTERRHPASTLISLRRLLAMSPASPSSLLKRPVPDLGGLPLERYVLFRWTTSSLADLDASTRRRRLAQDFTEIGDWGRYVSMNWACTIYIER
jgi:hypothetical protein